jgi:ABC-2 type transport system ATP-binding protein
LIVFLRDGTFVQDVNMKDGGPKDSTIISIDTEDYQKALEMLTEKFHVQQSNKENG